MMTISHCRGVRRGACPSTVAVVMRPGPFWTFYVLGIIIIRGWDSPFAHTVHSGRREHNALFTAHTFWLFSGAADEHNHHLRLRRLVRADGGGAHRARRLGPRSDRLAFRSGQRHAVLARLRGQTRMGSA